MGRRKLYERMWCLFTPAQRGAIREVAGRFGIADVAVVRGALDIGLPILAKLPIDNRASRGIVEKTEDNEGECR